MPTKTKKKTVRNRKIDLTISIRWEGVYIENRDILQSLFPRRFHGSGRSFLSNHCDMQFGVKHDQLEEMLNALTRKCEDLEASGPVPFDNWMIDIHWYFK